jgi:hypothetical protein
MKKHSINIKLKRSIFLASMFMTLLTVQPMLAQEDFEDDVDDEEEPAAPIDNYILVGLLAGGFLGIVKMNKLQ